MVSFVGVAGLLVAFPGDSMGGKRPAAAPTQIATLYDSHRRAASIGQPPLVPVGRHAMMACSTPIPTVLPGPGAPDVPLPIGPPRRRADRIPAPGRRAGEGRRLSPLHRPRRGAGDDAPRRAPCPPSRPGFERLHALGRLAPPRNPVGRRAAAAALPCLVPPPADRRRGLRRHAAAPRHGPLQRLAVPRLATEHRIGLAFFGDRRRVGDPAVGPQAPRAPRGLRDRRRGAPASR